MTAEMLSERDLFEKIREAYQEVISGKRDRVLGEWDNNTDGCRYLVLITKVQQPPNNSEDGR